MDFDLVGTDAGLLRNVRYVEASATNKKVNKWFKAYGMGCSTGGCGGSQGKKAKGKLTYNIADDQRWVRSYECKGNWTICSQNNGNGQCKTATYNKSCQRLS